MTNRQYQTLVTQVQALSPQTVLEIAGRCDGHSIFAPECFAQAGLPQEVVTHFTRTYRSDGSPKGTIFVDGRPVAQLHGVYGLELLRFLARALGVQYAGALGRGFEARNIQAALQQHLGQAGGGT